jgi:hypothetical protein
VGRWGVRLQPFRQGHRPAISGRRWASATQDGLSASQQRARGDSPENDKDRWPFVSHQWGMKVAPEGGPPPQPGDPLNGFAVAFALGELGFWLFGVDLPGRPGLQSDSDELRLLIWPSLSEVRWPLPRPVISDSELGELSCRLPTGTVRRGLRLD